MITYNLPRARQAVQYLVDTPYIHQHVRRLRTAVIKPRTLPFRGDVEVLNELLLIGRQNVKALENLVALAEDKHGDRNDYQREYMACKRRRDRKVILLEELMTGKKLAAQERTEVLHRQYKVWNKEREKFLSSMVSESWVERNNQLKAFWERKEHEIDALMAEAKEHGPVRRKRVVHVPPNPRSDFGKKLTRALDRH